VDHLINWKVLELSQEAKPFSDASVCSKSFFNPYDFLEHIAQRTKKKMCLHPAFGTSLFKHWGLAFSQLFLF
jgi:hypothetical protein